MKTIACRLAIALAIFSAAAAQAQLLPNRTLPPSETRAVILEFESPDSSYLGVTIARLYAAKICASMPGMNGARARSARRQDDRPSVNSDAPAVIAATERAVIAVWGAYYLGQDTVTVTSHAKIFPVAPLTELDFSLIYRTPDGDLAARLPTAQVNFPPVHFQRSLLDSVHSAFLQGLPLYAAPSGDAERQGGLPPLGDADFFELKDDWMRLRADSGAQCWARMPSPLTSALPRIERPAAFISGVALYSAGSYAAAESAFTAYANTSGPMEDAFNIATTRLLIGNARLRKTKAAAALPADETVSSEFERAAAAIPDEAAPAEHLAVTRMMRYEGAPGETHAGALKMSERHLIRALQDNPDSIAVNNLRVFYAEAERKRFLQTTGITDREYEEAIRRQQGVLEQVDRFLVIHVYEPTEFGAIRYGWWSPKDAEGYTIKGVNGAFPGDGKIHDLIRHGIELHVRNRLFHPVFLDVSAGGWYTGYSVRDIDPSVSADGVVKTNIWSAILPITIGASFSPVRNFAVYPYLNAGGGVAVGISNRRAELQSGVRKPLESEAVFAPTWYVGAGADVMLLKSLGLSLAAKYMNIAFRTPLYTGQSDVSALYIMLGLAFIP